MSDYEVAIEELEIKQTELNHSKAVVTIVLRRQESDLFPADSFISFLKVD
jgi:hypothetical protein